MPEPDDKTMFTQDQVNKINKDERLKREAAEAKSAEFETQQETLMKQIEEMNKTAQLSDAQKTAFGQEMEEMRQKGLTSEQKFQEQIVTLKKNNKELEVNSSRDIGDWKNRFYQTLVKTAIMQECDQTEDHTAARLAEPIVAILTPQVSVTEKDNKYTPGIKGFPITDSEGKVEMKDVSIKEAVNQLYASQSYRYLFLEKGKPGIGGEQGNPGPGDSDISDPNTPPEDPTRYGEWCKLHGIR